MYLFITINYKNIKYPRSTILQLRMKSTDKIRHPTGYYFDYYIPQYTLIKSQHTLNHIVVKVTSYSFMNYSIVSHLEYKNLPIMSLNNCPVTGLVMISAII